MLVNIPPPSEIVTKLQRYDPLLRLRWAHHMDRWAIERKMPPRSRDYLRSMPAPNQRKETLDVWDGWKDGYILVMFVHPSLIYRWPLVEETLRRADIQVQGGIEAINRMLDEEERQKEKEADRAVDNWAEERASESYDVIRHLSGNFIPVSAQVKNGASENAE